jgi:hypothetical protein
MVEPICTRVGKPDFCGAPAASDAVPGSLPISLAYSICSAVMATGLAGATVGLRVATCHTSSIRPSNSSDTSAARARSPRIRVFRVDMATRAQVRLMAKLATYSSGLAGSNTLPITVIFG